MIFLKKYVKMFFFFLSFSMFSRQLVRVYFDYAANLSGIVIKGCEIYIGTQFSKIKVLAANFTIPLLENILVEGPHPWNMWQAPTHIIM